MQANKFNSEKHTKQNADSTDYPKGNSNNSGLAFISSNSNRHPIVFRINQNGIFTSYEGESFSKEENSLIGVSAFEIYKNFPQLIDGIKKVLEGKIYWDTCVIEGPNGKVYFDFYSSPDINLKGEVIGAMGMAIDVTDSKLSEQLLIKSEEKYRDLVENIADWVWEVDHEMKYTYSSPKVKNILGYEIDEVIGKTPFDFMKFDEAQRVKEILNKHKKKQIFNLENTNLNKDGKEVVLETSGIPIFNGSGRLVGYRGVDRDITQRKKMDKKLKKYADELEELNQNKDKLISIISHDLKNPAQSVLGHSQMLFEEFETLNPADIKTSISAIFTSSKHLFEILDVILKWTRAHSNRINFEPKKIRATEAVEQTLNLYHQYALDKNISIKNKICKELIVFADEEMLNTIFRNLISNAIKFTPDAGEICIINSIKKKTVIFSIADNGIGIEKENLNNLFKIEHTNSTLGTRNEKGTGLGLVICKEFIEKHKGKIWAESEFGKGSKFSFSLPL